MPRKWISTKYADTLTFFGCSKQGVQHRVVRASSGGSARESWLRVVGLNPIPSNPVTLNPTTLKP